MVNWLTHTIESINTFERQAVEPKRKMLREAEEELKECQEKLEAATGASFVLRLL